MQRISLRMEEERKYNIIKNLVDHSGNKHHVASKLQCSIRTVNRLCKIYITQGKKGFVHGNRDRKPATTFDESIKTKVIDLYQKKFYKFNITHFTEFLVSEYHINISKRTVLNWLKSADIISPKSRRSTKRELKQKLKQKAKVASPKKQVELQDQIKTLAYPDAHPRRSRKAYAGELIQMDASEHLWFGDTKTHLHAAMDDSTGTVVGAYFDTQETLNGYYHVLEHILLNYGIPATLFTDRRTIFEYKKRNQKDLTQDTFTQFTYTTHLLGIAINTSSVPQAKGKIERLFGTFQSRLLAELDHYNISTLEQANAFLNTFIPRYNTQFALLNSKSAYESVSDSISIPTLLAIRSPRIIDNGHSIRFNNNIYIPTDKNGKHIYLRPKTKCLVIQTLDKRIYISVDNSLYNATCIPTRESISSNFDAPTILKQKKVHIPPMSHPFKQASFLRYLHKQKLKNSNAYV